MFFCMPTSSFFAQKLNYKCFSCIYVLNNCLHKLHLHIVCLPFFTFQIWRWLQWQHYSQHLNTQHSFLYSFQFLFYFYFAQQFHFLLLPLHFFMLPFPLLFVVVQLHSLHSYCYEFQNFENAQLPTIAQTPFNGYPNFSHPWTSSPSHSFFICSMSFN